MRIGAATKMERYVPMLKKCDVVMLRYEYDDQKHRHCVFVIAKKDVPLVHASQITRSLVLRILSSSFFAS